MKFILSVTDSGPLSMRARRELSGAETRGYIAGATVLGALAAAHAEHRGDAAEFNGFFGPDSRFGNLYPASFDDEKLYKDVESPILPLPATAVSCKRFSGFRHDQNLDEGEPHHGVHDTALAETLFALSGGRRLDLLDQFNHCADASGCREPMDRFEGFYRWRKDAVGRTQASRGLRTRAGISRLTGAVEGGILYSREVLNAGTAYWGAADVPKAWAKQFEEFVGEFSEAGLLRFGNNRTRGFGRARVEAERSDEDNGETVESLKARMAEFDRRLRAQAKAARVPAEHDLYVTITLTSEAILLDRLLRYQTRIDGEYLDAVWGISGAELLFQSGGTRRVMGWNGALGVPKGDETAVTMGSVFVFGLNRPLDAETAAKFLAMQEGGVGVRRREGFGQLLVASPFHYEMRGL